MNLHVRCDGVEAWILHKIDQNICQVNLWNNQRPYVFEKGMSCLGRAYFPIDIGIVNLTIDAMHFSTAETEWSFLPILFSPLEKIPFFESFRMHLLQLNSG